MKWIKIIPVVALGLFLTVNAGAANVHDENFSATEMTAQVESWMFDTNYLSGIAKSMESWMFDSAWLDQANDEPIIESWMLDNEYLVEDAPGVESWMLDPGYLNQ